jgi:exopolysaccharide biosynthesis WecB/TagA/CpsF family protein
MENHRATVTKHLRKIREPEKVPATGEREQLILDRLRDSGLHNFPLFDLTFTTGSYSYAREFIMNSMFSTDRAPPLIVSHLNLNNYYRLQKQPVAIQKHGVTNVTIFEGIAMKLGAFLLCGKWYPDLNATDLFPMVMDKSRHMEVRLYCLGAQKKVVAGAASKIKERYGPNCTVEYHHGYFRADEEEEIIAQINRSMANILLLGMGFHKEMEFATKHYRKLKVPLIWNVGGLFDFISGEKKRAPLLMRKIRLEWLFRLLLEPKRMFHRYVMLTPWWFIHIVHEKSHSRTRKNSTPD